MNYVFPTPPVPSVEVAGGQARFPVRRIFCVGRNYAEHAREMGQDPAREEPFFFTKPADAVVPDAATIPYPAATENLHHEVELVVALGAEGRDVERESALNLVYGYAIGLDLTRRDLQQAAKSKGRPWDAAKAFDQSAPCAAIRPAAEIGHPTHAAIWLTVDGELRQSADIGDMIWPVPDILSILSGLFRLLPGDLVFTGTPAGVGALLPGNKVIGGIDGLGELSISIA